MAAYLIRRLLLLPCTLVLCVLVLFGLLALVPRDPDEGLAEIGQPGSAEARRLFRAHHRLDLPVFLNLRPFVSAGRVREWVVAAEGLDPGMEPGPRLRATRMLEDRGAWIMPQLRALLAEGSEPDLRCAAARRLFESARPPGEVQEWTCGATLGADEVAAHWSRLPPTGSPGTLGVIIGETRFANWVSHVLRLDFGQAMVERGAVRTVIASRLPATLVLTIPGILLAWLVALPLGTWAAWREGTATDRAIQALLLALHSLPTFFTGVLLLRLLSVPPLKLFPPGDLPRHADTTLGLVAVGAWHLALPVATYTVATLAFLAGHTRAGMAEVLRQDWVLDARARGLTERAVLTGQVLRNGILPLATLFGQVLPVLFGGSVVVETVFDLPGLGRLLVDAVRMGDHNTAMGVLVVYAGLSLLGLVLADLLCALADPRIRLGAP